MSNKKKVQSISTGALLDLKAEVAKHEQEVARNKALGSGRSIVGRERPAQKLTVWSRQNTGVHTRAARDLEDVESKRERESVLSILEKKSEKYEQLMRGRGAGMTEEEFNTLLVDFHSKGVDSRWESDSDDEDESLTVPQPDEDDPEIEYIDEHGRNRTARRSKIPRQFLPDRQKDSEEVHENEVIRDPNGYYPVYTPSSERVEKISKDFSVENNPLDVHYDADREVRAKGAAFYKTSRDEENRRREMEELKAAREETKETRQKMGAVDVRPGEIEGMRGDESTGGGTAKSRGAEKRKKELEERKRAIAAKRRKVQGAEEKTQLENPSESNTQTDVPVFAAAAPTQSAGKVDPFAALENSVQGQGKGKAKASSHDDADAFLASLEKDMTFRKS